MSKRPISAHLIAWPLWLCELRVKPYGSSLHTEHREHEDKAEAIDGISMNTIDRRISLFISIMMESIATPRACSSIVANSQWPAIAPDKQRIS